jgi:hypothetical protein
VSQAKAFWITSRGGAVIGQRRRRPPQPTQAREHEDAIVWLAARTELRTADVTVLTERECRGAERRHPEGRAYSVEVYGSGGRNDRRRWPDLVIVRNGVRQAIEIEFTPKYSPRLKAIVGGYGSSTYGRVIFYVRGPRLAARLHRMCAERMKPLPGLSYSGPELVVWPWLGLDDADKRAIWRATERAS